MLKKIAAKILAHNPVSSIIFLLFKKRISFNHLTIRTISFLHGQRIPFHGVSIDVSNNIIHPLTKALLYWQEYEKDEISLVKKYLNDHEDVIELGASIGALGSVISNKQTTGRYIGLEANKELITIIQENLKINRKTDYVLINKAIDYDNKTVSFSPGDSNLSGKIGEKNLNASASIETITLSKLCNDYNFNDFLLVSDIEGAEITILFNDGNALKKCKKMIIELHDTIYNDKTYTIQDMVKLIIDHNFKIIEQKGNVFVFAKY